MDNLKGQEVDTWWGSYSPRGLVPELIVNALLSVLVAVPACLLLERILAQASCALLIAAWLAQVLCWGYRIFGWNYRLTTLRLFKATGVVRRGLEEVALARVDRVVVKRGPLDRFLGIGRVLVETHGSRPMMLQGVLGPDLVAEKIRALMRAQCSHHAPRDDLGGCLENREIP